MLIRYKDRRASTAVIPAQAGIWNFNASRIYRKKPKPLPPSFPRKWESRNEKQQEFIGNDRN
ncbi:hypothetical protein [Neisseria meningitidis]|uniref:hypothetical protein n=1 Tax=Neisseria meningitidis TaxID=487 RepID=UPI00030C692A|nr:hypothetical protein [Neisseria meningitidis]